MTCSINTRDMQDFNSRLYLLIEIIKKNKGLSNYLLSFDGFQVPIHVPVNGSVSRAHQRGAPERGAK